ncbi:CDP-glycerol glycerophosphotransferase family protein [Candidatus Saccharibacteria bacterium]|nr:CDP-glycerol glycerophosphotransferase family protein [Candidatus Saccharibacteria bacterium]
MKQKFKRVFFYGAWLFRYSVATCFSLLVTIPLRFSKKYKNLWLISERPDEARDNGYWLYKWIIENHPEINVRYVLSGKSSDYAKMPRKDLIIKPNSPKHYICHILSSFSVSTHMHGACPGKSFCIPFLPFMRRKKTIFLQHGITKDAIKFRGGMDAIMACSEQEKELIEKNNPNYVGKVFAVGFCRYDNLKDKSEKEKIILVMPTFRKWLRDIGRLKDADEKFKETPYYKRWNSFLNNKELEKILEKKNLKMIFFPHKEMQALAHTFENENTRLAIGQPGEYDVQELLKKSSVLITDYSSVLFDFVYMDKPVLFYQFDQKEFFNKHYSSSGKPYPFGEIRKDEKALIDELTDIINGGCKIKESFKKDADSFFKYKDNQNCERVYNLIKGLK